MQSGIQSSFENWKVCGRLPAGGRMWRPSPTGHPQPERRGGQAPEILYLNDLHGAFERFSPAWLAAREELEESGKPFVCFSGGDEHGGASPWDLASRLGDHPVLPFAWLNTLGVHAAVPGNHDIDWGWAAYLRMAGALPALPRILSHAHPASPLGTTHAPVLLLEWPQHIMAVFGALTVDHTTEGEQHLAPPGPVLSALVDAFAPSVDSLVILSHLGWVQREGQFADPDILGLLPPHALLLGAHSHTRLPADEQWSDTPYLQCAHNGGTFGRASWKDARWSVRNSPVPPLTTEPKDFHFSGWPPAARQLFDRKNSFERAAGTLTLPPHPYEAEVPARDGYRGECAQINAITDTLDALGGGDPGHPAALCVRAMTKEPLAGTLSAAQWYQRFGYADRCFTLSLPENTLWALLRENARRLLLPARFIETRGFLHFSSQLRYAVRFDDQDEPVIEEVVLGGTRLERDRSPALELTTHAYVAMGQGGYAEMFASCGIPVPGLPHPRLTQPVRDLFWHALRKTPADTLAARFRLDGRIRRAGK